MLRDAAVDLLMGRLGRRTDTALRDIIISEMVFVQKDILEQDPTLPWFLLSEKSTNMTVADEERVPLPDDFLQEWEEGALYIIQADGDEVELTRGDWDVLKQSYSGTGQPEYYDIIGDYILLRKTPDDVYTLKMRYYQTDASLAGSYGDAANIENNWLKWASALLIAETGVVIAEQHLQSDKMAALFMKQSDLAKGKLMAKDTAMRESNKIREMGA